MREVREGRLLEIREDVKGMKNRVEVRRLISFERLSQYSRLSYVAENMQWIARVAG